MAPLLFLWIAFVDTRWMMQDKKKKNVKKRRRDLKLSEHFHLIQMLIQV